MTSASPQPPLALTFVGGWRRPGSVLAGPFVRFTVTRYQLRLKPMFGLSLLLGEEIIDREDIRSLSYHNRLVGDFGIMIETLQGGRISFLTFNYDAVFRGLSAQGYSVTIA